MPKVLLLAALANQAYSPKALLVITLSFSRTSRLLTLKTSLRSCYKAYPYYPSYILNISSISYTKKKEHLFLVVYIKKSNYKSKIYLYYLYYTYYYLIDKVLS